jgi:acetylornithine deacetylase/succinyl-diaminopimelate desuccinylase-like protein
MRFVSDFWEEQILPALADYIRIPCLSPGFDPDWAERGHVDRALALVKGWLEDHRPKGSSVRIERLEERTPILLLEAPGQSDDTVLMYGHLDKQPAMTGWREGLSAFTPIREGNRLYGRGGADDGYAVFASVAVLRALERQDLPHSRVVVLVEFSEESGSPDLPAYVERVADALGSPSRVTLDFDEPARGWDAPPLAPWLESALDEASTTFYGRKALHVGDGGSIPFMGMLGERFPGAQFVITGVLGPESNAHGPNEFLEIDYAKKLTASMASVLGRHFFTRRG